eukprot:m.29133 g.29133  ORF g.29133 m.29133 type:complete len:131 (-) comp5057_c0_seq2:62-454(-)
MLRIMTAAGPPRPRLLICICLIFSFSFCSQADFAEWRSKLSSHFATLKESINFGPFAVQVIEDLCLNLDQDQLRQASQKASELYQQKQKMNKPTTKKTKKKATLAGGKGVRASAANYDYDEYADDFDDFM